MRFNSDILPLKLKIVLSFSTKLRFNSASSAFLDRIASNCSIKEASFKPKLSLIANKS